MAVREEAALKFTGPLGVRYRSEFGQNVLSMRLVVHDMCYQTEILTVVGTGSIAGGGLGSAEKSLD